MILDSEVPIIGGQPVDSDPDGHAEDAIRYVIDYPAQMVWLNRKDLPRAGWLKRTWWKLEAWWYHHREGAKRFGLGFDLYRFDESDHWRLDLYLGPLVFEWPAEIDQEDD